MSPYEYEAAAVQQEGWQRPGHRYLLTNFDTWVPNPYWDGIDPRHPEDPDGYENTYTYQEDPDIEID
jgi:hypothetical protein